MKAAEFDYIRAKSLGEVCDLLRANGDKCRLIAGGQTLVPLMAMRLARPSMLIDITHIAELQGIELEQNTLTIKACTRQRQAELSPEIMESLPLLNKALRFVGHLQTRNRGTIGGSLANADPAAEIPLVAVALDATLESFGPDGKIQRKAEDFFAGAMLTTLAEDECLTAAHFPVWDKSGAFGTGFQELSSRSGDFAIAAAAAQLSLKKNGMCDRLTLAIGGVEQKPVKAQHVIDTLRGTKLEDVQITTTVEQMAEQLDPVSDIHADVEFRRRMACVMAERALREARIEAVGQ